VGNIPIIYPRPQGSKRGIRSFRQIRSFEPCEAAQGMQVGKVVSQGLWPGHLSHSGLPAALTLICD
jgi:hypothetical protein